MKQSPYDKEEYESIIICHTRVMTETTPGTAWSGASGAMPPHFTNTDDYDFRGDDTSLPDLGPRQKSSGIVPIGDRPMSNKIQVAKGTVVTRRSMAYTPEKKKAKKKTCIHNPVYLLLLVMALIILVFGFILGMVLESYAIHAFKRCSSKMTPVSTSSNDATELSSNGHYMQCPESQSLIVTKGDAWLSEESVITPVDYPSQCQDLCLTAHSCTRSVYIPNLSLCYLHFTPQYCVAQFDMQMSIYRNCTEDQMFCTTWRKMCICPGEFALTEEQSRITETELDRLVWIENCQNYSNHTLMDLVDIACYKVKNSTFV